MTFLNRTDAGRQLADALRFRCGRDTIVVGVTRGGVPVAAELAREVAAPLEICVVRKLYTPAGEAFGCVAEAGGLYLDWERIDKARLTLEEIEDAVERESANVIRLSALYRDRPGLLVGGRDVIVVDDGLVIGAEVKAAAHSLRRRGVRTLELAVPVADSSALEDVALLFDHSLALDTEEPLASVGARYSDFRRVSEAEVVDLLEGSRRGSSAAVRALARRAY
jgi:putative phosphoribosyl transferase